ncbi:hypothetical protein NM688_g461 [Phlebia brevispora]|uniref:Uncharacterized protein n=1 Tax=Phlebia brevispora TaxID=194682 RepID=A0ACC1TE16_9APHY|nr:hypothetical protein NM688_g461 [Phlebia brevispora]
MMDKAEAMRFTACLPKSWWNFTIEHTVHIYNRTPLRRHNWRTPFELLFGKKPQVERLHVFRCGTWVHIPADVRKDKLEPKSELMVYLGNTSYGWKFMRSSNNVVFTLSQAVFEESVFPKCDPKHKHRVRDRLPAPPHDDHSCHDSPDDNDDDLPPGDHHRSHSRHLPQTRSEPQLDPVESAAGPAPRSDPPPAAMEDLKSRAPTQVERKTHNFARWKQQVGDTEPSSSSRQPHQHHRRQDPITSLPPIVTPPTTTGEESPQTQEPGPASDSDIDAELARLCWKGRVAFVNHLLSQAVTSDDNSLSHPREWTYRDILALPQAEQNEWKAACKQEIEALHRRQNRWVFDVKSDRRKRARLVARGFSQVEGIDYDQLFSPVVQFETVRLVLAIAALKDWYLTGLDVHNAYLYGELEEELYIEQPKGFKVPGQEHKVCLLIKALYGLKQARLVWWRTLDKFMESLSFTRLKSDAGVFYKYDNEDIIIVIIYIDDTIFGGPNKAKALKAKAEFMKKWDCRDLGELTEFLCMSIERHGHQLHIHQRAYLDKVLQRCGMQNCTPAKTPLPDGYIPLDYKGPVDPARHSKYQMVIGSLLYLMLGTRPDISFAVTKLAQHSANPSDKHLQKVLYICRYLQGTREYQLVFNGATQQGLAAYTDVDWGTDPNHRRSQTGFVIRLAGGAFSWSSRTQKTVAHSIMESEYMALSDCSRQVVWVRQLLNELGLPLKPTPISVDNQSAIFTTTNPIMERRSKHIDIRYHYICEVIERNEVEVLHIASEDNPADMFTKNLGHVKHHKFCEAVGLRFAAKSARSGLRI